MTVPPSLYRGSRTPEVSETPDSTEACALLSLHIALFKEDLTFLAQVHMAAPFAIKHRAGD